jgi:glutamyl-tRNA reductase
MYKEIVAIGLNHKVAQVEIRERFSLSPTRLAEALREIKECNDVEEAVVLSTCNRTEVYASVRGEDGATYISNFMQNFAGIPPSLLYTYKGRDAVKHLFEVSSSLDSMIIGEPQILGQVKRAYQEAKERGATGRILDNLFKHAFRSAKRVRSETEIGKGAVSVSYAAVEMAKKIFGDLRGRRVLVLGAGKMGEETCRHLISHKVQLFLSNRTWEKAEELAKKFGGEIIRFENFLQILPTIDILISSTSSQTFIVKREDIQSLMKERRGKPIFFIDIAIPRNIDPGCASIDNVYLYNIDDLIDVARVNLEQRKGEIERCRFIIQEEVERFIRFLEEQEVSPIIILLKEWMEGIAEEELRRAFSKSMRDIPEEKRLEIERVAKKIINRILRAPVLYLRECANNGKISLCKKIVTEMFNLERIQLEDYQNWNKRK